MTKKPKEKIGSYNQTKQKGLMEKRDLFQEMVYKHFVLPSFQFRLELVRRSIEKITKEMKAVKNKEDN